MDVNARARSVIESLTCSIHHQHPMTYIVKQKIQIHCCCAPFKVICLRKLVEILEHYKNENLL